MLFEWPCTQLRAGYKSKSAPVIKSWICFSLFHATAFRHVQPPYLTVLQSWNKISISLCSISSSNCLLSIIGLIAVFILDFIFLILFIFECSENSEFSPPFTASCNKPHPEVNSQLNWCCVGPFKIFLKGASAKATEWRPAMPSHLPMRSVGTLYDITNCQLPTSRVSEEKATEGRELFQSLESSPTRQNVFLKALVKWGTHNVGLLNLMEKKETLFQSLAL